VIPCPSASSGKFVPITGPATLPSAGCASVSAWPETAAARSAVPPQLLFVNRLIPSASTPATAPGHWP
jgi:hypothetical protein